MATSTARLGLRKPATGDFVIVGTDLNDNYDAIDANVGMKVCTSSTRPGTPFQGQLILETDTGLRYYWTGTDWFLIGAKVVRKTADQTINNSATFTNDTHLLIGLDVGTWIIDVHLAMNGASTTPDFKNDYTFTGTFSSSRRYNQGQSGTGGDPSNTVMNVVAQTAFNAPEQYAGTTVASHIHERLIGVVTVAGSFRMRWAQNVATAVDSTVFTNSFITAVRVA